MAKIVLGSLLVVMVGGGALLAYRLQPVEADESSPVTDSAVMTTTAVVVSSLACTDGAGGTLVDVLNPGGPLAGDMVRADLDACGYQEGEQLSVQYVAGDPTQVSLAGTDADADPSSGERLLPIGLVFAALLAAAAGAAVWWDSRRSRRRRPGIATASAPIAPIPVDATSAAVPPPDATAEAAIGTPIAGPPNSPAPAAGRATVGHGRHSLEQFEPAVFESAVFEPARLTTAATPAASLVEFDSNPFPAGLDLLDPGPSPVELVDTIRFGQADWSAESAPAGGTMRIGQGSSVDLVFPYTTSLADSLHDELFTHRSVYS